MTSISLLNAEHDLRIVTDSVVVLEKTLHLLTFLGLRGRINFYWAYYSRLYIILFYYHIYFSSIFQFEHFMCFSEIRFVINFTFANALALCYL